MLIHAELDLTDQAAMGWSAQVGPREGGEVTYRWYLDNAATRRG